MVKLVLENEVGEVIEETLGEDNGCDPITDVIVIVLEGRGEVTVVVNIVVDGRGTLGCDWIVVVVVLEDEVEVGELADEGEVEVVPEVVSDDWVMEELVTNK